MVRAHYIGRNEPTRIFDAVATAMSHSATVRVDVIDCGSITSAVHFPTAVGLWGVIVVSVADPVVDAREAARLTAVGARAVSPVPQLLDSGGVHAVELAMPSSMPAPTAIAAFAAGCHVHVEKPVATTAAGERALLEGRPRAPRLSIVGFNVRQHPLLHQARTLMQGGALGAVVTRHATSSTRSTTHSAWKQPSLSGALFNNGAPQVNIVACLFRVFPEAVTARALVRGSCARSRVVRADAEPSSRRALGLFVDAVREWPTLADGVRCLAVWLAAAMAAGQSTPVAVRNIGYGTGDGDA